MLEFSIFFFGIFGGLLFISNKMLPNLIGAISYIIGNILAIWMFSETHQYWLLIQNALFSVISIATVKNKIDALRA